MKTLDAPLTIFGVDAGSRFAATFAFWSWQMGVVRSWRTCSGEMRGRARGNEDRFLARQVADIFLVAMVI